MYDASLGRFFTQDRFSEKYLEYTPYHYTLNNPINLIDINGDSTFVVANDDGTYTVTGGNVDNEDDTGVYIMGEDGYEKVEESITSHSFFDNKGNPVNGAIIDPNSTKGQEYIDKEIIEADPSLVEYISTAKPDEPLDFKNRGLNKRSVDTSIPQHQYRGSVTKDGKFGSARDFGNMGAGIIAGRKGMGWGMARIGFDIQESRQQGRPAIEGPATQKAQKVGFKIGVSLCRSCPPQSKTKRRR